MKKITLLTAIAMIAFTVNTFGQSSSTTGQASVSVIAPLTVEQQTALNFGQIAAYDALGTLKIVAGGETTATNLEVFDAATPGTFTVTGDNEQSFSVTLPGDEDVTLSDDSADGNGVAMKVTNFNSDLDTEAPGVKTFNVGATLNVNALQEAGTYSGEYQVIVQYN